MAAQRRAVRRRVASHPVAPDPKACRAPPETQPRSSGRAPDRPSAAAAHPREAALRPEWAHHPEWADRRESARHQVAAPRPERTQRPAARRYPYRVRRGGPRRRSAAQAGRRWGVRRRHHPAGALAHQRAPTAQQRRPTARAETRQPPYPTGVPPAAGRAVRCLPSRRRCRAEPVAVRGARRAHPAADLRTTTPPMDRPASVRSRALPSRSGSRAPVRRAPKRSPGAARGSVPAGQNAGGPDRCLSHFRVCAPPDQPVGKGRIPARPHVTR